MYAQACAVGALKPLGGSNPLVYAKFALTWAVIWGLNAYEDYWDILFAHVLPRN